jgi:ABC-type spermidine/putrescine transport system permease subunit I
LSERIDIRLEGLPTVRQRGLRRAWPPPSLLTSWRLPFRPSWPLLLAAPLLLFMLAFYALPVLSMLMRSVNDPAWTLAHFAALAHDIVFLKVFLNTLTTSLIVTAGALLLGYPLALAVVGAPRASPVILVLILLPFWTSVLVRSYAWMVLLGRHGLVNEALLAAGLLDQPLRILNTSLATRIAMVHILLPYMVLPIANTLRQIDPSLARAASGLGATPWANFRQVTLPLSMPGVAAGVLLVFVLTLGFYITPAMVGGTREITLSMLIAQQVEQLNWANAATLSVVLLATALILIGAFYRLFGVSYALRTGAR